MMPTEMLFVLVVVLVVVVANNARARRPQPEMVCLQCGAVGAARRATPGSFGLEVVLWLLFIIPGLIYSIWRTSGRRAVCASCGSRDLIPADSPRGRALVAGHAH